MKLSTLVLAAVSVAALSASSAMAQTSGGMMADKKPMVMQNGMTGMPMIMVPMNASGKDTYMTQWVYRNLDFREVKRFRAQGFMDTTIKGAAQIAMRTGLPLEFILRMVREGGTPLATIAAMNRVPPSVVNADIPGYGAESMSITSGGMMSGSMGGGMMK